MACSTDNKTQFIDASGEDFFKKETNNNILTTEQLENIMQMFDSKEDVEYIAKSVEYDEISKNDYNLSVSSYVEAKDTREKIDIEELNKSLETTVSKVNELRADIDTIVKELTV